ncbi:protein phosphatase 2C 51-like isoform X1 [Nymphaea colorata]|uniref:protein phosphatase 2C 51-like isoform X1 n=1 Tax=Nymphaea colorata TaxID=210225 RepID=UPI00214EABBC|nr:protein phosphatase 2C 51-like isoform X1 [Nymphaea colorata]
MVAFDHFEERPKHASVSALTGRKRPAEEEGRGRRIGYRLKAAKEEDEEEDEPDFFCSRRGRPRSLSLTCLCKELCRLSKPTSNLSLTEEEDDTPKSLVADSISCCSDELRGHFEQGRREEDEKKKMYETLFGRDEYLPPSEDEDNVGGCRNGSQQRIRVEAGREWCSDLTIGPGEKFLMAEVGMVFDAARTGEKGSEASHGSVAVCGRRREMEDAVAEVPGFFSDGPAKFDFFAVYDGHGGPQVAEFCRDIMHRVLAEEMEGRDSWELARSHEEGWGRVMRSCFSRVDAEVGRMVAPADVRVVGMPSGSTALVALVGEHHIIVANCGDSRAVVARAGSAVPLSFDHKPERPDEMERVEAAGGKIINCDGYRVLGVLATSRSIGTLAFDYGWILAAILPSLTINFAGDGYLKPYVISVPEVTVTNRTAKDEFLVLASDGLWDVMSNELVCRVARRCLSGAAKKRLPTAEPLAGRTRSALAAATLAELALNRGSYDNISVVVVDLKLRTKRSRA